MIFDKTELNKREILSLKRRARIVNSYNFFGEIFTIKSDSEDFLKTFNSVYKRFYIPEASTKKHHQKKRDYYFVYNNVSPRGKGFFIREDEVYHGSGKNLLTAFANMVIFQDILTTTRDYFLIHASAVSFNNNGIIFAGAESRGKTTFALELVRRGFRFLSDEVAAVNFTDRLVHPFPRSITLCDGTFKLFKIKKTEKLEYIPLMDGDKAVADIDNIYPYLCAHNEGTKSVVGMPCRPRYLIFLKNRVKSDDRRGDKNRRLFLLLSGLSKSLLLELKRIDGVEKILSKTRNNYPFLELSIRSNALVVGEIERLCREHESLIIYACDELFSKKNDFNITPELTSIGKLEAMEELMKNFTGQSYMNLVEDKFQGSLSLMLVELADLFSNVECYNLSVGRLDEMADIVCDLVQ